MNTGRRVMQVALGHSLEDTELVHHINGNRNDNRLDNLQVVSPSEHRQLHPRIRTGDKYVMTDRRVGTYVCWGCHQEFPLYEGQRRRYCPECVIVRAREAGRQGGRGNKKAGI